MSPEEIDYLIEVYSAILTANTSRTASGAKYQGQAMTTVATYYN
jgi:hypothetical protein